MDIMKNWITLVVIIFSVGQLVAQKETVGGCDVRLSTSKLNFDGHQLFYSLPKNFIRVSVTVKHTDQAPGPYAYYAEKYLNISDGVIQTENAFYEIQKIQMNRFSRPDSSLYYCISCFNLEELPQIQLGRSGVMLGCNSFTSLEDAIEVQPIQNVVPMEFDPYYFYDRGSNPFVEELEEEKSEFSNDSTHVKDPFALGKLTETTEEQYAKEAADFIIKLRKRRLKLLVGLKDETFAVEGTAMQIMVQELKQLEEKYLELFVGKSRARELTYSFDFEPEAQVDAEQQIVGWFSPNSGFIQSKSDIRKSDFKPLLLKAEISGKIPEPNIQPTDNSTKSPTPLKHGLYYRIPVQVNFSLFYSDQMVFKSSFEIAQKGQLVPISADYLNGGNYSIEFSPETGALKKIQQNRSKQ